MTVILQDQKIAYVSVPKCACSSVKRFLFHVENGFAFRPFRANGGMRRVHDFYPSVPFADTKRRARADHYRVCIVRDPVSRLRSAHRSKMVEKNALSDMDRRKVRLLGLSLEPSFGEFVKKLRLYRLASGQLKQHTERLSYFLGKDPSWYAAIFDISRTSEMEDEIVALSGTDARLKTVNKSGAGATSEPVSEATERLLRKRYAEDYDLFGRWFGGAAPRKLFENSPARLVRN